jgi:hypothetical protein
MGYTALSETGLRMGYTALSETGLIMGYTAVSETGLRMGEWNYRRQCSGEVRRRR